MMPLNMPVSASRSSSTSERSMPNCLGERALARFAACAC